MSDPEEDWFQAIPALQFNPASLTGSFQPIFADGIADNIKIMTVYNGGSVAVDVSFDGINLHQVWPEGATLIIDFQTNHRDTATYGKGTLYGRAGQNVWVRTSVNSTWLTVGGFR